MEVPMAAGTLRQGVDNGWVATRLTGGCNETCARMCAIGGYGRAISLQSLRNCLACRVLPQSASFIFTPYYEERSMERKLRKLRLSRESLRELTAQSGRIFAGGRGNAETAEACGSEDTMCLGYGDCQNTQGYTTCLWTQVWTCDTGCNC
jgi:hypothetical protein